MQSQKWQNDLCSFPRQTFNITVIQVYAPTSNTEETEWFYQDLLELKPKKDVLFIIGDWNAKVESQETPWVTGKFDLGVQNEAGRAKVNRVLPREHTGHSKDPLPTAQKKTTPKSEGQHQNQIDYILCSQRWRSSIQSAKTRLRADCGSDHELLIVKFRHKFKKVGKTTKPLKYDLKIPLWLYSGSEK